MLTVENYRKADWRCPRCNETNYKGERWCFYCRLDAEQGCCEVCMSCGKSATISDAVRVYVRDSYLE